jgi:hypothetical protein
MNLEIANIYADDYSRERPEDTENFVFPLIVEISEKDKPGSEVFHFVAASPLGLSSAVQSGEFRLLRGYILMQQFDWDVVQRAVQNLVNHAQSRQNWNEVVEFFNRYGRYDSEDYGPI